MIIVIDPGHGGDDPGAVGVDPRACSGYIEGVSNANVIIGPEAITEAALNWDMAGQIIRELMGSGRTVNNSRLLESQGMALGKRAKAAQGSHCLVSIHHNAAESRWARGFEIYVHKHEVGDIGERDMALASLILEECRSVLDAWGIPLRNPPIKADADWASRGRLTLLAEAQVPACLIEVCFMSNPLELIAAQMPPFRWAMAAAISRGITRFGKEVLNVL